MASNSTKEEEEEEEVPYSMASNSTKEEEEEEEEVEVPYSMASNSTKEEEEEEEVEVLVVAESEDDGESGAESFLTDEEVAYQQGIDPEEDLLDDDQEVSEEPSTSAAGNASTDEEEPRRERSRSRGSRSRGAREAPTPQTRSRSLPRARPQPESPTATWKTDTDPDSCPVPRRFIPARPPGHQLNSNTTYTPLDLFKLFFSNDAVQTLCHNTNKQAAKNIERGKKYSWTDLDTQEFFKYVGLTFFFALVKLDNIQDYWKKRSIFSVPFPANVMPRDRYRVISWNVHMSDPERDAENDRRKGTPDHDRLFRLKPLLDSIRDACKSFYHPRQNLSVDERVAPTNARAATLQHMKGKPTKWGFKLFALADGSNGYTWDFTVYTGKSPFPSGVGLAYDSVMSLVKTSYLGSGFHLYVDHFYTSPKLFRDLFFLNIGACGTYKDNRRGCPRTDSNALRRKDPRGSIRWIRDGLLVFVKWMDAREVAVCSTIHPAYSGSTVQRRVRSPGGDWDTKYIPCPTPVVDYNKHMGAVDLSDQLIQYYVHHKTTRWYRTLFFHFLDIAATNSFLLHKELCREKQEQPMTHRLFLQELTAQLCGVAAAVPPAQAHSGHLPVPISDQPDASRRASYGRRTCLHCRQTRRVRLSTPWKCMECDVALCVIADRNCFKEWHS